MDWPAFPTPHNFFNRKTRTRSRTCAARCGVCRAISQVRARAHMHEQGPCAAAPVVHAAGVPPVCYGKAAALSHGGRGCGWLGRLVQAWFRLSSAGGNGAMAALWRTCTYFSCLSGLGECLGCGSCSYGVQHINYWVLTYHLTRCIVRLQSLSLSSHLIKHQYLTYCMTRYIECLN